MIDRRVRERRLLAIVGVLLPLLSFPVAASAKGDWSSIKLHGHYMAPEDRVRAEAEFFFWSEELFERARRGELFYAYLIAEFDFRVVRRAAAGPFSHDWWTLGAARPIPVGTLGIDWKPIPARAEVGFVMPDLEPGTYALMFCDLGCLRPLGDIVPAKVTVVEDPLVALLARRLERREMEGLRQLSSLQAARRVAKEAREEAKAATEGAAALATRIRELEARVATLEEPGRFPSLASAGWLVTGAVCALVGARVLSRRKLYRRRISSRPSKARPR
jgi:hypothetical protein